MKLIDVAIVHGRFQPLHNGHMEYLLTGKERCRMLIIGITNPDPWQIKEESKDLKRGLAVSNPCTFYERYVMIERAMADSGISPGDFRIVPFPISFPERVYHYVPMEAQSLLTIYDEWGESKLERLERLNVSTTVLWRRTEKVTTGTSVRTAIARGEQWSHLVPTATVRTIKEFHIDERIRNIVR